MISLLEPYFNICYLVSTLAFLLLSICHWGGRGEEGGGDRDYFMIISMRILAEICSFLSFREQAMVINSGSGIAWFGFFKKM